MSSQDRYTETRNNLMKIVYKKGAIYALGICIGILSRLTRNDYNLYKEIAQRASDKQ